MAKMMEMIKQLTLKVSQLEKGGTNKTTRRPRKKASDNIDEESGPSEVGESDNLERGDVLTGEHRKCT